jgi:hypothetical protein
VCLGFFVVQIDVTVVNVALALAWIAIRGRK